MFGHMDIEECQNDEEEVLHSFEGMAWKFVS
jgi:hypothetical protein